MKVIDSNKVAASYLNGLDQNKELDLNRISFSQDELNNEEWRCIATLPIKYKDKIKDRDQKLYTATDYYVSNLGRIAKLDKNGNLILLPVLTDSKGYKRIIISSTNYIISRLVAYLFIYNDDPINKTIINHKDEYYVCDNRAQNLEWCDYHYNINYGTRTIRAVQSKQEYNLEHSNKRSYEENKLTNRRRIKCIFPDKKEKEYESIVEAFNDVGDDIGIQQYHISNCCLGKIDSIKGYKFEYADDKGIQNHQRVILEPIVRLTRDYKFIKLYLCSNYIRNETNNGFKLNFTTIVNICTHKNSKKELYLNNRWIFLSEYNKYLISQNEEPLVISINICMLTVADKFIKEYTNIMDIYNDGYNLNSVLKCCDGVIKKCFDNIKWMYTEDFLKMKNASTIDNLDWHDKLYVNKCKN